MGTSGAVSATYGYAFAALSYTAFALYLLRRHVRLGTGAGPAARRAFMAALVASAAWGWSGLLLGYVNEHPVALVCTALDLARYGAWLSFLLLLLHPRLRAGRRSPATWLALAAGALLALALAGLALKEFSPAAYKPLAPYALFGALALPLVGLILVEQLFRNAPDESSRWSAKPLCLALVCVFAFDLYIYSEAVLSGKYDGDALSIRGVIHALAVPLLLVASRRESNWLGKLNVSRAAMFHSATTILAGVYLLCISAIGYYVRYFGGEWGPALQLGLLFVALILLSLFMLSGAMRAKLRVLVGKHFFAYRYDYRQEWLRFTATLSSTSSPQEVGGLVIRGLADMLESPAGALWSKNQDGLVLMPAAQWNMAPIAAQEPLDSGLSKFLRETGWIISIDEYRQAPERYAPLVLPEWILAAPNAWLVIPLLVGDDLIGFVLLARARAAFDVNWEVTDLLKTASRQAAGFLAQMRATEALLEARKFDAFNRMSAFVVHDLKNIVTQLSLMMKNAKRLRDNPEFQEDMLMTVENSLEKMRQLMLQLREGQTPPTGVHGVDLAPIARSMQNIAAGRGRLLEVQASDRLVARGHEARIERVLGHMVQNALDATPSSGRVWVKFERDGGRAKVEVGDTGLGMTPDFVRDRLFKPFHTTKDAGMGIGAYESYQYIRELGGQISVDSQPQQGTRVTILLPLFDAQPESDLHSLAR
ncbi:MAG: PEP-CTERM system histidine kinase PrsK [Proteobacteria bacterium]|nr:PEP-CTERM system histidine kinase PrsK [Pseudomonadota bacterium]